MEQLPTHPLVRVLDFFKVLQRLVLLHKKLVYKFYLSTKKQKMLRNEFFVKLKETWQIIKAIKNRDWQWLHINRNWIVWLLSRDSFIIIW